MHAYRFRILSEDNEDFLMDIDLKASQSFLDFHQAIKQFCNITTNELASFYICDDKWRKKTEIMLIEMGEEDEVDENITKKPVLVMENAIMNKIIDNPHQKFLYIYDFIKMHTFYIELMQIKECSPSTEYPALVKKEGELNLRNTSGMLGFLDEEEIETLPEEEDDPFFGSDADPDELDNLGTDAFFGEND